MCFADATYGDTSNRRPRNLRMRVADEAEGRAVALRRIALCRETHAEELDLGGLQLTELPDEILELTWLPRLLIGPSQQARNSPDLWADERVKFRNPRRALPHP